VQAVSLLQENCTAVNEALSINQDKIVSNFNFCNINNLTPGLLTGLISLTNFTGYTGSISFDSLFGNFRRGSLT
jgi:hypothetical protein